jgi:hypothetical protein
MMFIRFFIGFLLLTCSGATLMAQADAPQLQANIDQLPTNNNFAVVELFSGLKQSIAGTPFLYDDWLTGTIIWTNGKMTRKVPLKFITFGREARQIMARRPQGDSIILILTQLRQAVLYREGGDSTILKRVVHAEQANGELLEVVQEGDRASLYIRHNTVLLPATVPGPYSNGRNTDTLEKHHHYLLKIGKGITLHPVRARKKDFLEALKDKNDRLKDFCKRENIDFDNPADLKKLLLYHNSL